MNLQQIYHFVYYNLKFACLIFCVLALMAGWMEWFCNTKHEYKLLYRVWESILLLEVFACLFFFFYAAFGNREISQQAQYELELFWSYKEMIKNPGGYFRRQILWNIFAFFPIGNAIQYLFYERKKWWQVFLMFLMISTAVEVVQLCTHIGLFEFDDIFDNVLGGMLGYGVAALIRIGIRKFGIQRK